MADDVAVGAFTSLKISVCCSSDSIVDAGGRSSDAICDIVDVGWRWL